MRVFQVDSSGLASLFDAHHNQEAAEHGECSCPPGICLEGAQPLDVEFDVVFQPEFHSSLNADVLSPAEQLDQLGTIVEGVTALAGLYASMVDLDRSES